MITRPTYGVTAGLWAQFAEIPCGVADLDLQVGKSRDEDGLIVHLRVEGCAIEAAKGLLNFR